MYIWNEKNEHPQGYKSELCSSWHQGYGMYLHAKFYTSLTKKKTFFISFDTAFADAHPTKARAQGRKDSQHANISVFDDPSILNKKTRLKYPIRSVFLVPIQCLQNLQRYDALPRGYGSAPMFWHNESFGGNGTSLYRTQDNPYVVACSDHCYYNRRTDSNKEPWRVSVKIFSLPKATTSRKQKQCKKYNVWSVALFNCFYLLCTIAMHIIAHWWVL